MNKSFTREAWSFLLSVKNIYILNILSPAGYNRAPQPCTGIENVYFCTLVSLLAVIRYYASYRRSRMNIEKHPAVWKSCIFIQLILLMLNQEAPLID